jgi:hypothetical protein
VVLPAKIQQVVFDILLEQAQVICGLAQTYVRVDTGSLRDSIRVDTADSGPDGVTVVIKAGGLIVNPKTGRLVDYADIVEAKYPFMAPAFLQIFPQIQVALGDVASKVETYK